MARTFTENISLPVLKHRAYKVTTSGTPNEACTLAVPNISCQTLTRSGTTATFTASAAHRLADGQYVTVSGADQDVYNVTAKVTVTGATTFTYTIASDPGENASGTIVAAYSPISQWALLVSATTNDSAGVYIGPDVNADLDVLTPGGTYVIPAPTGTKFYVSDWYVKSAAASQVITVLFL